MSTKFAYKAEITSGSQGATASTSAVVAAGAGTQQITVKNTHGSNTLYVGWDSTIDAADTTTYFIGGDLAAGATITLSDYNGAIWLDASGASTTYLIERRIAF
ncbi:MAG: hypothetical protein ACE5FA_02455 [Dehalococcoidia bacterium]